MARERLRILLRELSHRVRTSILMGKIRRMSKTARGKMKLRMLLLMLKQSNNNNWDSNYYINNRRRRGHGFAAELQYEEFSASSTPLIVYRAGHGGRFRSNYLHSLLLLCRPACLGGLDNKGRRGANVRLSIGSSNSKLPDDDAVWWAEQECDAFHSGVMVEWKGGDEVVAAAAMEEEEEEEVDSVDEKAERFIERFYQEMRLQRRQSL
ncbi:unnamed protein product [Linum trigynum]|uniref:Uncharacterized protein n=1 Tax=Linum trigynum TaxID=586398 RepID=A0AAV2GEE9_9ROSI